jgi:hypothetical protein
MPGVFIVTKCNNMYEARVCGKIASQTRYSKITLFYCLGMSAGCNVIYGLFKNRTRYQFIQYIDRRDYKDY